MVGFRLSTAALMLVKDEADVIEHSVGWLLGQVDRVYVTDNLSTDGTYEILDRLRATYSDRLLVGIDDEVGYFQADKMTALAEIARDDGYDWAIPADADEFWRTASPGFRLGDYLDGLTPSFVFAAADLFDHKATLLDGAEPNPARRMPWRFREPGKLPKVAVRLLDGVRIGMGNHDATVGAWRGGVLSSTGTPPTDRGSIVVEHYPWRTEEQFLRKITNGARAYAATNLSGQYGAHWRAFGMPEDEGFELRVRAWFHEWGYTTTPQSDPAILYSPFPFP